LFELDVRTRELHKRGVKVSLPDQPFQVLRLLLEHPGEVVTRDELRQRLWPADTFVNFDLSLNSAVRKLREALGDSAEHPTFIETLPRQGYRFIAPVERSGPADVTPPGARSAPRPRPRAQLLWAIGALVGAAGALTVWMARSERAESQALGIPHIRSIAVLPLRNLTGDPAREYVVDGITAGLIAELAQVGTVPVVSGTSSMHYKGAPKRLPEIARELNVDALVEGTAALSEGKVHLNVRLIHAATDRPLWAHGYERDAKDVLAVQAEVARAIVAAVQNASEPSPSASSTQVVRPDAYDLYLNGIAVAGRNNPEGFRLAVSYFEQAITRQPDFAQAYGKLALTWTQFLLGGSMAPDEVLPKAEAAGRKALALDGTVRDAHRALAITRRVYGDQAGADAELDTSSPDWLIRQNRFEDALIAAERNHQRDPLSVNNLVGLASALRRTGHGTRAIAELQKALALEPGRANVLFQFGATCVLAGETKAGIAQLEQAVARSSQRNQRYLAYLGYAYARDGRLRESRQVLQELLARRERQYVSSFGIALLHDAFGHKAAALAALDRASREHAFEFTQLDLYPPFKTLAAEPRYQELMRAWGPIVVELKNDVKK
jgi:TolB-like protein/DNA-binding winged helix-turn-helix (wHTH) protein